MTKTFKEIREEGEADKVRKIVKIVIPKFKLPEEPDEDMSLAPKGKGREGAKKLYKASYEDIEDTEEAVTPAQRRARKQAYLKKTMAKYGLAAKMGIPADQVNQRRNHPTRKKA